MSNSGTNIKKVPDFIQDISGRMNPVWRSPLVPRRGSKSQGIHHDLKQAPNATKLCVIKFNALFIVILVTRLQTVHGPNVTRHQKWQQWSHLSSSRYIFKLRNSTRLIMLRRRCGYHWRESFGWDCWHVFELAMQETRCWWCPKHVNSGVLSKFQHILTYYWPY